MSDGGPADYAYSANRSAAMPPTFGTPEHWRQRAAEARAMAENMTDPQAKRAMLRVADSYEEIAKRVEALAASRKE